MQYSQIQFNLNVDFQAAAVKHHLIQLKLISPKSRFINHIQEQIEELGYKRWVQHGNEEEFYTYTLYHPRSIYKPLAEDEIYQIYTSQNDTMAFKRFIQLYPKNKNLDKIWRAFYQLSAGNYDQNKMRDFIARYPMYPYAENVRAELERFGKELYPYASPYGLMGYMDEQGISVIPAVYDWVGDFKEGLAVVMKESSYGVINKQGQLHLPIAFEFISDFSKSNKKISNAHFRRNDINLNAEKKYIGK